MSFEKFVINQNPGGNPVVSSATTGSQYVFSLKNFSNAHFNKLTFRPTTGGNAISCNGSRSNGEYVDMTCQDVTVEHCRFYRESPKQEYVDNSAIYLNCSGVIVSNNKFYSYGDETMRARGCIETHGGKSVITGNYSEGYATGVNIASRAQGKDGINKDFVSMIPSNVTVTGNTFTKVKKGIQLWVNHPKDNIKPVAEDWDKEVEMITLENVLIGNNTISVDVSDYEKSQMNYNGISFAGDHKGNRWVRNLIINANNIIYTGSSANINVEEGVIPKNFLSSYGIGFTIGFVKKSV